METKVIYPDQVSANNELYTEARKDGKGVLISQDFEDGSLVSERYLRIHGKYGNVVTVSRFNAGENVPVFSESKVYAQGYDYFIRSQEIPKILSAGRIPHHRKLYYSKHDSPWFSKTFRGEYERTALRIDLVNKASKAKADLENAQKAFEESQKALNSILEI